LSRAILALCLLTRLSWAQDMALGDATFRPSRTNSVRDGTAKEYLAGGQTSQNWTRRFEISWLTNSESPRACVIRLGEEYRKQHSGMVYIFGQEESLNRFYIDYLVPPQRMAETKYVAWSFLRAQTNADGGLLLIRYDERRQFRGSFQDALDAWNIRAYRRDILPSLITNDFVAAKP
jgi:hypothetical protein